MPISMLQEGELSGAPDNLKDGTIDAGLWLFDLVRDPARMYSQKEIAAVCGCSPAAISYIERRAMEKIAKEFAKRLQGCPSPASPAYVPPRFWSKAIRNGNYDNISQRYSNNM